MGEWLRVQLSKARNFLREEKGAGERRAGLCSSGKRKGQESAELAYAAILSLLSFLLQMPGILAKRMRKQSAFTAFPQQSSLAPCHPQFC